MPVSAKGPWIKVWVTVCTLGHGLNLAEAATNQAKAIEIAQKNGFEARDETSDKGYIDYALYAEPARAVELVRLLRQGHVSIGTIDVRGMDASDPIFAAIYTLAPNTNVLFDM